MSEKISLSKEEMSSLFSDSSSNNTAQNESNSEELMLLADVMQTSLSKVKGTLSSKLLEEVECSVSNPVLVNGLQTLEEGEYYVTNSNFTNNGKCDHYFVYSSEVGFNLAKRYSGLDDITNSLEEVRPHVYELTELILHDIAEQLERGFQAHLDDVVQTNNINEIDPNTRFIRFVWTVGTVQFYEFFNIQILDLLQEEYSKDTKMSSTDQDNAAADVTSLFDSVPDSSSSGETISSFFGNTTDEKEQSESIASLGEELLKDSQSVSNVALPELGDTSKQSSSVKHDMDILYGVSMELTVELGNTRMRLEEILELNRGSIIELRKLAGEPLDITINNKLIAKGEVVVIDENFGVRIIEIISPKDRMKEMQ